MQHAAISRPRPLIVPHLLLLLAEEPRHGYELAESLRSWKFKGVTTSTVYRELSRLEEDGLVRSFWQSSQTRGPVRHMYELTSEGRADLAACADDLRGLMSHLTEILSRLSTVDGDGDADMAGAVEVDPLPARRRRWRSR
jgi:PadR family transcriptional regulator PadR